MISETEYAQAVAEFMTRKGVTRCPTVCAVPTRASLTEADRAALRDYETRREEVRRARLLRFGRWCLPAEGYQRPS